MIENEQRIIGLSPVSGTLKIAHPIYRKMCFSEKVPHSKNPCLPVHGVIYIIENQQSGVIIY